LLYFNDIENIFYLSTYTDETELKMFQFVFFTFSCLNLNSGHFPV